MDAPLPPAPEPPRERRILHVDLDAFYASVEQRDDPSLRGKPVIVGGTSRRGVVCAASYEARPFGVKSAMSMVEALKRCPHAVVLPPRMGHYAEISRAFFSIAQRYTPLVEALSLDEAFLDVSAVGALFGDGPTIARRIKDDVRAELDLVVSVGVAPSKFVAKVASDLGKPDGLLVVAPGAVDAFLHPLPVSRLWGVGRVTEATLRARGFSTIGDLARTRADVLVDLLGPAGGAHLRALALGIDARAVEPDREAVSIGHEETFERDVRDRAALVPTVLSHADRVAARLRAHGLRARTVTVKIKYADHTLVSRRTTLPVPTADDAVVASVAVRLLARVPDIERRGVRLTGVAASSLFDADAPDTVGQGGPRGQLTLGAWADTREGERASSGTPRVVARGERVPKPERAHAPPAPDAEQPRAAAEPAIEQKTAENSTRGEALGFTLDDIRRRFGHAAIKRAVHLGDDE